MNLRDKFLRWRIWRVIKKNSKKAKIYSVGYITDDNGEKTEIKAINVTNLIPQKLYANNLSNSDLKEILDDLIIKKEEAK